MKFSLGIDWLQGILVFENFEALKNAAEFLAQLINDKIPWQDEHPFFCGVRWNHSVTSVRGIKISWNLKSTVKCLFVLPGQFWSYFSNLKDVWDVCLFLSSLQIKITRIDIRLDDYSKKFLTYQNLSDAIAKDNYSGAQIADIRRPKIRFGGFKGWTIYFGSSSSDKRIRFYDKFAESEGKINSIRMEVQYRDERANYCFDNFVNSCNFCKNENLIESFCSKFLLSILVGSISFCDIESSDRQDKRKLLIWWKKFIDFLQVKGQKVPSLRPCPTADSRIRWLFKVACSIFTIYEGLGHYFDDFWQELIESAYSRLSQSHRLFIDVCRYDIPVYRTGIYSYQ